jgi:hypothetical protein
VNANMERSKNGENSLKMEEVSKSKRGKLGERASKQTALNINKYS